MKTRVTWEQVNTRTWEGLYKGLKMQIVRQPRSRLYDGQVGSRRVFRSQEYADDSAAKKAASRYAMMIANEREAGRTGDSTSVESQRDTERVENQGDTERVENQHYVEAIKQRAPRAPNNGGEYGAVAPVDVLESVHNQLQLLNRGMEEVANSVPDNCYLEFFISNGRLRAYVNYEGRSLL